jgi:hypothetical protein
LCDREDLPPAERRDREDAVGVLYDIPDFTCQDRVQERALPDLGSCATS